jgi:putative transposase
MSSTYLSLYYHAVYSTQNREPLIQSEWRSRLHEYLGGTANRLLGQILGVGGTIDHVHLLVELNATHCLADFMRELKKASSSWARETAASGFAWQKGYAAFTVSASNVLATRTYIRNQEEHHRQRSFREELVTMLNVPALPLMNAISTDSHEPREASQSHSECILFSRNMACSVPRFGTAHCGFINKPEACRLDSRWLSRCGDTTGKCG